jgi:hypothetical protein
LCERLIGRPPSDPKKRDQQCKVLTESILSQIILKLDDVYTEGNATARTIRKTLIEQATEVMRRCDEKNLDLPEDAPDVVILNCRGQEYKLDFVPFAISDGKLLVGDLRKYAARWLKTDAKRLRLLYKREPLEDDRKPATYYGVKQNSTVSCVLTEGNASAVDSSSDDVDSVSADRRQRRP